MFEKVTERALPGVLVNAAPVKATPKNNAAQVRFAANPLIERARPSVHAACASPQWDFIQVYAQYTDILECPRIAHVAVAIAMLSAVLNRKVQIKYGGVEVSLDVWMLLLSESGLGRNTLLRSARRVLKAAGLQGIVHDTTWGSKEAVYQQIAENPCGLYLWPEMAGVLKRMADQKFGGIKEWLTNCYDEFVIPERITYRRTGKPSDTPEIVFAQAPRLNILASSAYPWFVENLAQEDAAGGFIPRWTIVDVPESNKSIPKPGLLHPGAEWGLGRRLSEIAQLEGPADLSQVEGMYDAWYKEAQARFRAQGELAEPFFNRLRAQVLKFAVIFEVSAHVALRVSPPAMEQAIGFANRLEKTIFGLLPTGMSREGAAVEKMAARIKSAGPDGIMQSELTREFQHWKYYERIGRLRTLLESGEVVRFVRKGFGRPAELLVHKEFVEEHTRRFPDDNRA
jgi:hypothetical protein